MTQNCLRSLASNAEIFNEIKTPYGNILKDNGFKCKMSYETNDNKVTKRYKSRRNRILCFNQIVYRKNMYCSNINVNLGIEYLKPVDKHFTTNHIYRKVFNKKTLKTPNSCMNNVKSIQSHHNFIFSKYNNKNNITDSNVKKGGIY